MTARMLVIDPSPLVFDTLRSMIPDESIDWTHFADARGGLDAALAHSFDLLIVEVATPGMRGASFLAQLRQRSDVPVLVLSERCSRADRAIGLQLGADVYMGKPPDPLELAAQVQALLRRPRSSTSLRATLRVGDLVLDPQAYQLTAGGEPVHLTSLEFDLLGLMMRHPDRPVTRDDFAHIAHGRDAALGERALDTHVRNLRRKLGHERILTRHGTGYLLRRDDRNPAAAESGAEYTMEPGTP